MKLGYLDWAHFDGSHYRLALCYKAGLLGVHGCLILDHFLVQPQPRLQE